MGNGFLYDINGGIIAFVLLALALLNYELTFRLGRYLKSASDKEIKKQASTIQAGTLGLLALLLGFTFNMAMQRFDDKSKVVIKEANAIGTAMLRSRLLPPPYDSVANIQLQCYLDFRLKMSELQLPQYEDIRRLNASTDSMRQIIWDTAIVAAKLDPNQVKTGLFISALNELIDARDERNALLQIHVPEIILFLLFFVIIVNCGFMGYSSGLSLKRAYIPTFMLTLLITLVVFIIIDLDRPTRGLIRVNNQSLIDLKK